MEEIRGWAEVYVPAMVTMTILLLALLIRAKSRSWGLKLPPGPPGWPLLGSIPSLGTLPHRSLYELSKQYGPLMLVRLGSVNTLVINSPKQAKEILKTHDKITAFRPLDIVPEHIFYGGTDIGWAPDGQYFRYVRKVATVGLVSASRVKQFREIREREVLATLHFILEESQRGIAVDMTELFSAINMNNITQMMMNKSYSVRRSTSESAPLPSTVLSLKECFEELTNVAGAFNLADFVPILKPFDPQGLYKRAKNVRQKLDDFLDEIIKEHQERALSENDDGDFIDALLAIGKTTDFQEKLSMESIKALLFDIIAAAGNTASTTCSWALTELLRNPSLMGRVQVELDSIIGPNRLAQEEDLPQLKYLEAVVKETFRIHPAVPILIPRESIQDCEIEGFHIPAKTRIIVNSWGIQRDPSAWDRPTEFNPDRFLSSTKDYNGLDFEFLPFGSGRRKCPGINLGLVMVLYPLALLLHSVDWSLPEGQKPQDLDMAETFGLLLFRKFPLTVFGKARLPTDVIYQSSPASA